MSISEYFYTVVQPMIKHPEELKVTETQDPMGVLLTVDVNAADMGMLVGRSGETAKAIRHIVRLVGFKAGARVSVKINEPEGSKFNRAKQ